MRSVTTLAMKWATAGSGLVRTSSKVPEVTIWPSSRIAMVSASRRLLAMSWLMITEVMPNSCWVRRMRLSTNSIITGSRPVVGSSKSTTSGFVTTARARATRFFMPPERSLGMAL